MEKMKDRKVFDTVYRKAEAIYGRTVTDLDIERAYNRFMKIVKD